MADPYRLERFVAAQRGVIDAVRDELRRGRKTSHWMWFIFPQVRGLGRSSTAAQYAISGRGEAEAYLKHETLGARLRECTEIVNAVEGRSALQIFGDIDAMKFRSSLTLFDAVAEEDSVFGKALDGFFSGERDSMTLDLLT